MRARWVTLWAVATMFGAAGGLTVATALARARLVHGELATPMVAVACAAACAAIFQGNLFPHGGWAWGFTSVLGTSLGWFCAFAVFGAVGELRANPLASLGAGALAGGIAAFVQTWWLASRGVSMGRWVFASALSYAAAAGLVLGDGSSLMRGAAALALLGVIMGFVLETSAIAEWMRRDRHRSARSSAGPRGASRYRPGTPVRPGWPRGGASVSIIDVQIRSLEDEPRRATGT